MAQQGVWLILKHVLKYNSIQSFMPKLEVKFIYLMNPHIQNARTYHLFNDLRPPIHPLLELVNQEELLSLNLKEGVLQI